MINMACWEITHWVCWFSHYVIFRCHYQCPVVFLWFSHRHVWFPEERQKSALWKFEGKHRSIHQLKEPDIFRQTQILQKLNASWETDDKTLGFTAHTVGVHDGVCHPMWCLELFRLVKSPGLRLWAVNDERCSEGTWQGASRIARHVGSFKEASWLVCFSFGGHATQN